MSEIKSSDIPAALSLAMQLHGSGKLPKAERIYRQVLAITPNNAVALHYLGLIALQVGQSQAAIELIEKAVKLEPNYFEALSNLGNAQQASNQFEPAIKNYQKSLGINPDVAMTRANLGNALCQVNRLDEAVCEYQSALKLQPDLSEVHRNLASLLLKRGKNSQALSSILRANQLQPNSVSVQMTMGNILQELSKYEEALVCYQNILQQNPEAAEVHCNVANVLRELGKLPEALSHYQQAIEFKKDYAEAHFNFALAYQDLGEFDSAINHLRKAIEIEPLYAKAHRLLAQLVKHLPEDDDIKCMQNLLATADINQEQEMYFCYALGKSWADSKNYQQAFEYYQRANQLCRKSFDYDMNDDVKLFSSLKTAFTRELFNHHNKAGLPTKRPIFIIGMPRSGTTLVEQILASHSNVYAAGELSYIQSSLTSIFESKSILDFCSTIPTCSSELFAKAAQLYLEQLNSINSIDKFITDKLPMNFLYIGMIKLMFPNAQIIHCKRDSLDTCFSIYKNYFAKRGHSYAYSQAELAAYYKLYQELMIHWERVLPDSIYTIEYEKLIQHQEAESRQLLSACGLEWQSVCLDFHKTKRQVNTLSAAQVRKPLYADSVGQWKNYREQLATLMSALNETN